MLYVIKLKKNISFNSFKNYFYILESLIKFLYYLLFIIYYYLLIYFIIISIFYFFYYYFIFYCTFLHFHLFLFKQFFLC